VTKDGNPVKRCAPDADGARGARENASLAGPDEGEMPTRALLTACLVFSGLSALVYQVLWTRLLGFAFGTTTEAIGTVLAVFFAGMALGNWIAARRIERIVRPLRLYAMLELGIGGFALFTLPLLRSLDGIYALTGADLGPGAMLALRAGISALILLPPTVAMGATLPAVARGLVASDASLGRWSAYLYSANTLGAVAGAYLCGFWMIPGLGLTRTIVVAAAINLAVAAAVWAGAGHVRTAAATADDPASIPDDARLEGGRRWFLLFFGLSGFVAIGYEIVWSKVFTIVMEGTLYGFSTVLSAYLLGLALGSMAIARRVDGIRDLPRAFGLLHAAIAVSVAVGLGVVADLPFWHARVGDWLAGASGIHGLYLLAAPIVLLPTMLFGAAFPVLIRLYTARASRVGEGMGIATAVNTAGSIAASLSIGFYAIPQLGIDATLYALVVVELVVAVVVLLRFQTTEGRRRVFATAGAGAVLVSVTLGYNGVHVEHAVAGRWIEAEDLQTYRTQLAHHVAQAKLVVEGRTSVVSVNAQPGGWKLMTNGMPEAGYTYAPPHRSLATLMLAMLPYVTVESPERALVVGFGGGATLDALLRTRAREIEVVELEERVVDAARLLYQGRAHPLDDPRVRLVINDGRNHLLLGRHRAGAGYDLIASQPSHPWLAGAANLFTEEYFTLARDNLNPGGAFALWLNGFHAEPEALLALFTSFHRVFPDGVLVSGGGRTHRSAFVLVGTRPPHTWSLERLRARLAEPAVAEAFEIHRIESAEELLAYFEGPLAGFAAIEPGASNTDDNAFVEMRLSRALDWVGVDWDAIDARVAGDAPVLPPFEPAVDVVGVARAMLDAQKRAPNDHYARKLHRLLAAHGEAIDPYERAVLAAEVDARALGVDEAAHAAAEPKLRALVAEHPTRPEAARALALGLAERDRRFAEAAELFLEAWRRSGRTRDLYDATRAIHWVDPARAWALAEQIPPSERDDYPRLAFFAAERALDRGAAPERLARHLEAVQAYLETREGRELPGVHAVAAALAERTGDEALARWHRDADALQRAQSVEAILDEARAALADADWPRANDALERAKALAPLDPVRLELEARAAAVQGDAARLSEALWAVRRAGESLRDGVGDENALRAALGLPLLPERPPEELGRAASDIPQRALERRLGAGAPPPLG
jgi:spermidine synthase